MESTLFSRIQHYVSYRDYTTAIFLCEQLLSFTSNTALPSLSSLLHPPSPSPPSSLVHSTVLLLAQCYYDTGDEGITRAYHLLCSTLPSFTAPLHPSPLEPHHRYLLALSAFHLSLLPEAERYLLPLTSSPQPIPPCLPSSFHLLGLICERTGRVSQAIAYHRQAVQLDPFLWSAIARLTHLGVDVDVKGGGFEGLFLFDKKDIREAEERMRVGGAPPVPLIPTWPSAAVAPGPPPARGSVSDTPAPRSLAASLAAATPSTVGAHSMPALPLLMTTPAPPPVPSPTSARGKRGAPSASPTSSHVRSTSLTSPLLMSAGVKRVQGQQRILSHFPSVKHTAPTPPIKPAPVSTRTRSVGPVTKAGEPVKKKRGGGEVMEMDMTGDVLSPQGVEEEEVEAEVEGVREGGGGGVLSVEEGTYALQRSADRLSSTLRTLTSAYSALCQYSPQLAISLLSSLPPSPPTPFTLTTLARAHFDRLDYPACIAVYEKLHERWPYHMEGMDVYSTALWQCKRDGALASLAHHLTSPPLPTPPTAVACVVVGNLFSLQRDHDTSLRMFHRALQLSPRYAYAHVLCGHEWVSMEDYTRGVSAYRLALSLDGRQYQAWYGIGHILYSQEKWSAAAYHFSQALSIHPHSPLLHVYLALAYIAMEGVEEAKHTLLTAVQVGEGMGSVLGQVYYQLASLYATEREWAEALRWCERVEEGGWREAAVFVLKGRVLKRMGRVEEAMYCFIKAMDLDPKDGQQVKGMMERMLFKRGGKGKKGKGAEGEDEQDGESEEELQGDDGGF